MREVFFLLSFLFVFQTSQAQFPEVSSEKWSVTVLEMKTADQELRKKLAKASAGEKEELQAQFALIDEGHHAFMKHYLADIEGSEGLERVEPEVLHSFWILTMHQDNDVLLQKNFLSRLETLKKPANFIKRDMAFLMDRIAVNENRKQVYGTQVREDSISGRYVAYPILDSKKVKKLRKKMKLKPLEVHLSEENAQFEN